MTQPSLSFEQDRRWTPRSRGDVGVGVLVAWLITFFMLPAAASGLEGSAASHRAKAATALVVAIDDADGAVSFGSGFFVGRDGLLLTNAHVVADHTRLFVYRENHAVDVAPRILALDADLDLAALQVDAQAAPALPLARDVPDEGTSVIASGYPRVIDVLRMGLALHTSAFPVTIGGLTYGQSRTTRHPTAFLQTTGLLNAGISGGPLVHPASGHVVGMVVHSVPYLGLSKDRAGTVTGTVQLRASMSYAIPAFLIHEWLTSRNLSSQANAATAEILPTGRAKSDVATVPSARNAFATAHLVHTIANVLNKEESLLKLAIHHYTIARRQQPKDTWILRSLGRAHAALEEWDEAYEAYRLALAGSPHDAALHAEIGDVLYELDDDERAYQHYSQALERAPCSAQAHTGVARILWKTGRRADGFKSFQEAFRCAQNSPSVVYNLGLALTLRGAHDKTIRLWEGFLRQARAASPKDMHLLHAIRHNVNQLKDSTDPTAKQLSGSHIIRSAHPQLRAQPAPSSTSSP